MVEWHGGEPDDDELERSNRSLDALYRRYAGWLRTKLRQRFGRLDIETEDFVQEAYVRLARYDAGLRERYPKALLLQIASNLARDALRRRDVQRRFISGQPNWSALQLEADQLELLLFKQIILGLGAPYRDVLLLARFTAMSHADIAAHLGISVKTVEWRLSKALRLCAERMQ